jgi:hypothetical protein
VRLQGWHRDPFGNHGERWFSDGRPTNLVRDQGTESYDEPPRDWLPPDPRGRPAGEPRPPAWADREWRWWTVCLPGLLALAVAGLSLMYSGLAAGLGCMDGCYPFSEGRSVGTAGEVVLAIAGVALLAAGLTMPDWRRPIASALWVAFALACGGAVLIVTARQIPQPVTAEQPVIITPPLDAAACQAIGGWVLKDSYQCYSVPFVGADGERYFGSVQFAVDGQLTGPSDTSGMGATRAECESGRYPLGPSGPVKQQPGRWDAQLSLCLPA